MHIPRTTASSTHKPERPCHRCATTGQVPCRFCGGSGQIVTRKDIYGHPIRSRCTACFGRRVSRCLTCGGAGRV